MRRLILALVLVTLASAATAQNCPRGMLQISGPASYVAVQGAQTLNLSKGFTIECWVQPAVPLHGGGIVDKGTHGISMYGMFVDTGGMFFGSVRKNAPIKISTPPVDTFGYWHHIAYTVRPGDSIYLYIDSFEVASMSAKTLTAIDSNSDSLRIGLSATGVSFIGSIDEFRVWNTPRSLAQIRADLYGVVAQDPSLTLYYSFDDGFGFSRIHDFSGHGRDGYLQGASVAIVQSTSPVLDASPGWQLATKEQRIVIPTIRCRGSFDTVIHIHNLGPRPESIRKYAFFSGRAFSITSNFPIPLPADSSVYASIVLHFEPSVGGVFEDTLSIIDSNECGGTLRIGVRGIYDSVGLAFAPSVLSFDSVLNCDLPLVKTVRITNVSTTDSITLVSPVLPVGLMLVSKYPKRLGPSQSTVDSFVLMPGVRGSVAMQTGITLDKCSRTAYLSVTATRQVPEWSVPAVVNFGSVVADLNGVTRDTTITVRNTGNVTTAIQSVTSSDTALTVLDARKGIPRAPGDTLQLRLRIHPQACGHVVSKLRIRGSLCAVDTTTLVSIDVAAPLPLRVPSFDVGRICPSQSVKRIVVVSNPNDKAVRLDTTMFSQNNVFFTPPLYPNIIPAHDSLQLEFLFQPPLDGDYIDTAFLQMSPCGTAMAVLRGSRGYAGLSAGVSVVSFGRGCDTNTQTSVVTITNNSQRQIAISDTVHSGSARYTIRPESLPFSLDPGQSKQFAITYRPVLGSLDTGSLILIGAEGCTALRMPLRGSREIGSAGFLASVLDFDTVCPGSAAVLTVRVHNRGVDSLDISSALVSGHGFELVSAPHTIGDTATIQLRYNGYLIGRDSGTLMLSFGCGSSLLLPLRGVTGPPPSFAVSDPVMDFGAVKVGVLSVKCVTISNPSCIPLTVRLDSAVLAPFTPEHSTLTISPGESIKLCISFDPRTYGSFSSLLRLVSDSAPPRTVTLNGIGLAPDVRLTEHRLDFGYVLRGAQKTLAVHLTNRGNDATPLAASNTHLEFTSIARTTLGDSASDSILVTFSPLQISGLVLDTLIVNWSGHLDTVYLRGQGTEAGMIASATALDFGDVHVMSTKTLPIYITATQDRPTVQSVALLPKSSPAFSDSAVLPHLIGSDHDTLTVGVHYHPTIEQRDTGYLLISDGAKTFTIMLIGRGVEAHAQVHAITVDYGSATIGTTVPLHPVSVTNTGTYPLYVTDLKIDNDFVADNPDAAAPITPGDSREYLVTFTPVRARHVVDSLYITTTAPEILGPVALSGTGIYPPGTGPSFGYRIASTQTAPGERDTIPVSIYGTRLPKIDADSLRLVITYDPSMIWMHGIVSDSAHRFSKLSDSIIECAIKTSAFSGTLFSLDAEALLGPHTLSYIHVKQDEPHADIAESSDDGLYQVIDCGGTLNGVVLGRGYLVQSVSPNPASDNLTMKYQLGMEGPVQVEIIDELGRTARQIQSPVETAGTHMKSIDVSALPAGRYVYRLRSLDFVQSGSVLLVR